MQVGGSRHHARAEAVIDARVDDLDVSAAHAGAFARERTQLRQVGGEDVEGVVPRTVIDEDQAVTLAQLGGDRASGPQGQGRVLPVNEDDAGAAPRGFVLFSRAGGVCPGRSLGARQRLVEAGVGGC